MTLSTNGSRARTECSAKRTAVLAAAAKGSPATAAAQVSGSHRLALSAVAPTHGCVDGAWWPNSADLGAELPDLVAVFSRWIGPVHRVVFDPTAWATAPTRLIRHGSVVSMDPYPMINRETICLMGTHSRRAVLFVIASSSRAAAAECVLREVSDAQQPINAVTLRMTLSESAQH